MATKTKKSSSKSKFDFKTIKTYEDACVTLRIDPNNLPDVSNIPTEFRKPIVAGYKLLIIFQAINNGWKPDWSNWNEYKYYPWFGVLSFGFGFAASDYSYGDSATAVGSRLCTDSSEKAMYIAENFKDLYTDYFLYQE